MRLVAIATARRRVGYFATRLAYTVDRWLPALARCVVRRRYAQCAQAVRLPGALAGSNQPAAGVRRSMPEVQPMQLRVQPALREQLAMRALFHQASLVEHQDAIRCLHGAQAVRNDERGAAAQQFVEGFLDAGFGGAVDAGAAPL